VAQFLKEEVAQEIARAALRVFAARGYRAASLANIAREAGTSTGNVYRYFENKEVLFAHVVPLSLQARFLALLKARVLSTGQAGFAEAAEALTEFSLTHRLELAIMLGRADDTPHQGFAGKVRSLLEAMALAHFAVEQPSGPLTFALREVYGHFVSTMVSALLEHEDASAMRAAVETYTRYHWAGMRALFDGGAGESPR
jgi:AcrR family transcriptional regulator